MAKLIVGQLCELAFIGQAFEQIAKAGILRRRHVQLARHLFRFKLPLRLARERFEHAFNEVFFGLFQFKTSFLAK